MCSEIDFYCLNYTDEPYTKNERRIEMERKFTQLNIPLWFYSGVTYSDERIKNIHSSLQHTWSICYGHLDMINHFLTNSNKEYAIICEDDILIHKDFANYLDYILDVFKKTSFDLLLLGYLCSNPIHTYSNFYELHVFPFKTPPFITNINKENNIDHCPPDYPYKLFNYPDSTWGTQMYMISKKQAKFIIDKYYDTYAMQSLTDSSMTVFSGDWTITKEGKRAVIYPLLVIENGLSNYEDEGQDMAHKKCFNFSYIPNTFI